MLESISVRVARPGGATSAASQVSLYQYCAVFIHLSSRTLTKSQLSRITLTHHQLVIALLVNTGAIEFSAKVQTTDLKIVLPATILCVEMGLVSVLHMWAYSSKPYIETRDPTLYHGGFLGVKAILHALNPWDMLCAIARAMHWLVIGRKTRHSDVSYDRSEK